ncbi:GntR family transcriptional regulator [Microbacterium resistens]|uniref:GntR family transcriptional regulator n=1 Tax=Microbacterium resistens TaxID=156977 RepID=UPI00082ED736|nr:GntR family transcriptional regulator [Microbacterium resistens]MBW1639344.1 GntR family transcriptional regulator [Microbacterium resistens]
MPVPKNAEQEPAKRTLLRDTVLQRIREAILDGTLQPGERLHDDQIEAWLGVSRTPIRDALNELSRVGLVEMAPNRYTRVAVPVEEEALAALQTLGVILGGVTRLAVPRLSGRVKKDVLKQFTVVVRHLRADDGPGTNAAASALWRMIAKECGNPLLFALFEQTIDGLAFKLRVATVDKLFDFAIFADRFEELAERIREGDAIGAELAVERAHLLPPENATA